MSFKKIGHGHHITKGSNGGSNARHPHYNRTEAQNIAVNCGTHRNPRNQTISNFAYLGDRINRSDITGLLTKIKNEMNSVGRGGSSGLPSSIGTYVKVSDFQKMANAVGRESGVTVSFGTNIVASQVVALIDQYNKITEQCICHSDCGTNTTCSCHNNCGCHY